MFFALLLVFGMVLSACAPAAEPVAETVVEATEAPVVATEAPVVVEETGPDAQALFTALYAELPADKGYGSVKVTALNEELVENAPFILDVREAADATFMLDDAACVADDAIADFRKGLQY